MYRRSMATFQERFKELRDPSKITQQRAAEVLGVSLGLIGKWENGHGGISTENLQRIADATGATTDYITGRSDEFVGPPAWWPASDGPAADPSDAATQRPRGDERRRGPSRRRQP